MEKKIYAQPQLDVTRFETEDIIVTSPIRDENIPGNLPNDHKLD